MNVTGKKNFFLFLMVLQICSGQTNGMPQPIGMWMFNKHHHYIDVSGHMVKHDAKLKGGAILVDDGPYPEAYGSTEVNGNSGSHILVNNTDRMLSVTGSWTYTTWFKPLSSANGPMFMFMADTSSCTVQARFSLLQGLFHFNTASVPGTHASSHSGSMPVDEWRRFAVTYDTDAGFFKMFVSGSEVQTARKTGLSGVVLNSAHDYIRIGETCHGINSVHGRFYCTQWYDQALTVEQLQMAERKCKQYSYMAYGWPHPVGHWPLNQKHGNADISGNANNALFKDITYGHGPDGMEGGAAHFSASKESYVTLYNDGVLNLPGSHTIAFWMYLDEFGQQCSILDQASSEDPNQYRSQGDWLRHILVRSDQTTFYSAGQNYYMTMEDTVQPRKWYWVINVLDQSEGLMDTYMNGKLVHSGSFNANNEYMTGRDYQIGSRFRGTDSCQMRLSCFQIYDTAISPEYHQRVKDKCYERSGNDDGLLYRWPLTSNMASTASYLILTPEINFQAAFSGTAMRGSKVGQTYTVLNNSYRPRRWKAMPAGLGLAKAGTIMFSLKSTGHEVMEAFTMMSLQTNQSTPVGGLYFSKAHACPAYQRGLAAGNGDNGTCLWVQFYGSGGIQIRSYYGPDSSLRYPMPRARIANEWIHYTMTWETRESDALYVNGELVSHKFVPQEIDELGSFASVTKVETQNNTPSIACIQIFSRSLLSHEILDAANCCYGDANKVIVRPLAYWPLDAQHGARDISGRPSISSSTLNEFNVIRAAGINGRTQGSTRFNGTIGDYSSYAVLPYNGQISLSVAFTISVWFYPEETNTGSLISSKADESSESIWALVLDDNGGIYFRINWDFDLDMFTLLFSPSGTVLDGWNSATVVFDNKYQALELYVNDQRVDREVVKYGTSLGDPYKDTSLYLAKRLLSDGTVEGFVGRLACVRIHDYPLNSEQIKESNGFCIPPGTEEKVMRKITSTGGYSPVDDNILRIISPVSLFKCLTSCTSDATCLSASYFNNEQRCELSSTSLDVTEDFTLEYEYTGVDEYYEVEHPIDYRTA